MLVGLVKQQSGMAGAALDATLRTQALDPLDEIDALLAPLALVAPFLAPVFLDLGALAAPGDLFGLVGGDRLFQEFGFTPARVVDAVRSLV